MTKRLNILAVAVLAGVLASAWLWPAAAQQRMARVGVLAYRGVAETQARWQPLIDYLDDRIPGWKFELIPLTLASAPERLKARELDFVVTNPGHYVTLAERYNLSALATRRRRAAPDDAGSLYFGTVIFVRADRGDIQTLTDLKGKTLLAVSPDAFGGFQMAWFELIQQGVEPFADLAQIRFMGFPQDAIVMAIRDRAADAGVVRSGLLETMAHEGRIELKDFRVLQNNFQVGRRDMVSSRMYPEWPFAAVDGADRRLADKVVLALLETSNEGVAERYGLLDLWSAPLSYEGVRVMVSAYQNRAGVKARSSASDADGRALSFGQVSLVMLILAATAVSGFVGGLLVTRYSQSARGAGAAPGPVVKGADAPREGFDQLTRREREVLSLICRGHPTKVIAAELKISPKTVEYHRANLLHKTKARSTPRMVRLATQYGFDQSLSPSES